MRKNTIFKHHLPLIITSAVLSAGIVFAFFLDRGHIDAYFQEKYYHPLVLKIHPVKRVKIGFTTDVHARIRKTTQAINDESRLAMESFAAEMRKYEPDFIVDGGDFIEGTGRTEEESSRDFKEIQKIQLSDGEFPAYYVLGNHELRSLSRQKWLQLTQLEEAFYYFDVENLRVIVLDGNFMPSDSQGDIAIEPGLTNNRGYVSQEQMAWLEDLLGKSKRYRKIVFIHYPPLSGTNDKTDRFGFLIGAANLRKLFTEYGVKAVFSGHIEEAYRKKIDGVDYFVTPGFHKDNDGGKDQVFYKGVFSEIEIKRNVNLKMFYKNPESGKYEYLQL